jgi:hypothetical protein
MFLKYSISILFIIFATSCSHTSKSNTGIRDIENNKSTSNIKVITATFQFDKISKQGMSNKGSFEMVGNFDKRSHQIFLKGTSWLKQPIN